MKMSTVVFVATLAVCLVRPGLAQADDRPTKREVPLLAAADALAGVVTIAGPLMGAGFYDLYSTAYATGLEPIEGPLLRTRNVHFVQAGVGAVRTGLSIGMLANAAVASSEDAYYRRLGATVLVQAGFDAAFAGLSIGELARYERDRRLSSLERESDAWVVSATPFTYHGLFGVGMGIVSALEFVIGGLSLGIAGRSSAVAPRDRRVRIALVPQGLGVGLHGSF